MRRPLSRTIVQVTVMSLIALWFRQIRELEAIGNQTDHEVSYRRRVREGIEWMKSWSKT